jgi:hypothetical protein
MAICKDRIFSIEIRCAFVRKMVFTRVIKPQTIVASPCSGDLKSLDIFSPSVIG